MKTLILCLALTISACAPKTIVTTPGQIAFTADQVVLRVNELQNAAIAANASRGLDDATTKAIVTWSIAADKTLKTTPAGWQQTLVTSWAAVKPTITTTSPALLITIGAVDALIGGLK